VKRRDDPNQLSIDWTSPPPPIPAPSAPEPCLIPIETCVDGKAPSPLVQRLPWDFEATFPMPTEAAIEEGVVDESDGDPENLKALHDNYTRECLGTLRALDVITDARRRGVDPGTGKKPRTKGAQERLSKYFAEEPGRLKRTFEILIDTYGNAFGSQAADAFSKFLRARHAGIAVESEGTKDHASGAEPNSDAKARRLSSRMPVPKPLPSAVALAIFGWDEKDRPIRPRPDEVRAITEQHAHRMMDMNQRELAEAVAKYAQDFGLPAAEQLERYVQSQRVECEAP
jgi:hypothetical protein